MLERRRFVRISEDSPISYEVLHYTKMGEFLTKDISIGGVRFFVHEFVPKNALLKIKLTLQKTSFHFEAIIKVVWIKEEKRNERYEIGAEFIDISNEAKKQLIEYIKKCLNVKWVAKK